VLGGNVHNAIFGWRVILKTRRPMSTPTITAFLRIETKKREMKRGYYNSEYYMHDRPEPRIPDLEYAGMARLNGRPFTIKVGTFCGNITDLRNYHEFLDEERNKKSRSWNLFLDKSNQ
jgi:hypothetical protein